MPNTIPKITSLNLKPGERTLYNKIRSQITQRHFLSEIPITLTQEERDKFGSDRISKIVNSFGYSIVQPNFTFTFLIKKKK